MLTIISFFQSYPIYFFIFIGLLGLIIGNFLNVIVYRFFRVATRYYLIELLSGILSVVVAVHFGVSWQTVAMLILTWGLIAIAAIDYAHLILPDVITLPLLWFGLLLSLFGIFTSASDAIIGAVAGFSALWLFAEIFRRIRHIEGMGRGDYKLLAMFGAWAGWRMLPLIVLIAALLGTIVGISLILFKKKSFRQQFPFGPYLAIAGWMSMLWGQEIYKLLFNTII